MKASALALLLCSMASAAPADDLTLTNIRLTYGVLGPTRPDTKLRPGDSLILSFTIEGVRHDAAGKVSYSTAIEITDTKGKVLYTQPAKPQEGMCSLGGHQVPAYVQLDTGVQQPAGEYTVKVTVTDLTSKKSQTLTQKAEVLPRDFALVRLTATADADGKIPLGPLGAGQSLWINASAVGFGRDAMNKQPHLSVELRVLDDAGKPTLEMPLGGIVNKNVDEQEVSVPLQFRLSLNRPGKFTVELKATDRVSSKTDTRSFPITVLAH